jgi:NADH dehydrogenase
MAQVALPAMQQGEHAAAQIGRRLRGLATEPFRFHDLGTMATIGRQDAVAEFPNGLRLAGFIGWVAWLALHIVRLVGVRNRASVFVNWAWNYLTYDRGSRLIAEPLRTPNRVDV